MEAKYWWYIFAGVFFLGTVISGYNCIQRRGRFAWFLLLTGTCLIAAVVCASRGNVLHGVFSKERGNAPYQYQIEEGPNRLILESDSPIRIIRRGGSR